LALLTYSSLAVEAPYWLFSYIVYTLRNVFKVMLPIFFIYRVGANPALLIFWIDNFIYILIFSFIVCKLSNGYKYFANLFFIFGGIFLTTFYCILWATVPVPIVDVITSQRNLVQMLSEACLSFTVGTSFLAMYLWQPNSPTAPYSLLVSILLLGACSFFAPFNDNIFICLFYVAGYTLGVCCYYNIKMYNDSMLITQLFYFTTLGFLYFTLVNLMLDWVLVLNQAVKLSFNLKNTYEVGSDEFILAEYLLQITLSNFNDWWHIVDLTVFLSTIILVFISLSLLSFV